jgi:hypothetical protein
VSIRKKPDVNGLSFLPHPPAPSPKREGVQDKDNLFVKSFFQERKGEILAPILKSPSLLGEGFGERYFNVATSHLRFS